MKFDSIYFLQTTRPGAFQKGNEENCLLVVQINIAMTSVGEMPFLCCNSRDAGGEPGAL